jgi:hypothetical protein
MAFNARVASTHTGDDLVSTLNSITSGVRLPGQRYEGEMHVPGMNFARPETHLDLRLNPDGTPKLGSPPIDRVDEAAYHHDIAYNTLKDAPT